MKFQWRSNHAICPGQPVCSEQEWEETGDQGRETWVAAGAQMTSCLHIRQEELKVTDQKWNPFSGGGGGAGMWNAERSCNYSRADRQLAIFEAWPVCRLRWILSQIWGEKEAVKCKIERWSHSPAEDRADRVLGTVLHPDSGRHGGSFRASSPTFSCLSGRTLAHSPFLSFHLLPTLPG